MPGAPLLLAIGPTQPILLQTKILPETPTFEPTQDLGNWRMMLSSYFRRASGSNPHPLHLLKTAAG
jgi:hypothetical protein